MHRHARHFRLLCLCAMLAAATADEIVLRDGSVIDGEVLRQDDREVVVRVSVGGMTAERSWPRAEVVRIASGPSRRQQDLEALRRQAAALPAAAPAGTLTSLAQRARPIDPVQARTWAAQAVARDRHQAEAQRLLGRELVRGVWLRPHEAATARGEVWHDGRWMPWDEQQRLLAAEHERRERQRAAAVAAAERRERSAGVSIGTPLVADYTWPWRQSYPGRVIWWGGYPQQPVCHRPGSGLWVDGGWGNVDWKLHLTW